MSISIEKKEKIIAENLTRLLTRVNNSRSLRVEDLSPRVAATLEKYLLRDAPDASEITIKEFLETIQLESLCLVVACEKGDETAWNELVANFNQTVKSAARSVAPNADAAEDLAQSIWAELHGLKKAEDGKKRGKLGYYSGRGSLAGWLRAVVSQLAVDAYRKQSRFVQIEENREFENLANESDGNNKNQKLFQTAENPEEILSEKRAVKDVADALKKAIIELEAEDRLLVKLYYFDNLNLKHAGAALGVHEATASRRITRIHNDLRKKVEKVLQTENGWKPDEIKRGLSDVAEKMNVNLQSLLTAQNALIIAFLLEILRSTQV